MTATCRASFGLYNTTEEVDKLVDALELCRDLFIGRFLLPGGPRAKASEVGAQTRLRKGKLLHRVWRMDSQSPCTRSSAG